MKTKQVTREQFDLALAKWRELDCIASQYRIDMDCKYGQGPRYRWTRKEQTEYEKHLKRTDKAQDKFLALLQAVSPRDWSHVVPISWILAKLTWDMAISSDTIETPEPAFGYTLNHARQWAGPVRVG